MQINLQFSEREYLRPQVKGTYKRVKNQENLEFYFLIYPIKKSIALSFTSHPNKPYDTK